MAPPARVPFVLAFTFLLFAASALPSRSITIDSTVQQLNVTGRLSCTVDGNPVAGLASPPLVGANVTIACNGGRTTLGQALTNPAGLFEVIYTTADGVLFDSSTCIVGVTVANVVSCVIMPPTRVLGTTIVLVRLIQGPISHLTTAFFQLSPWIPIT